jgi:hypothetical protein
MRLRRDGEIDFHARNPRALHLGDIDAHAIETEARRQRPQPLGIEAAGDERAERHVAGDAAEGVKNR